MFGKKKWIAAVALIVGTSGVAQAGYVERSYNDGLDSPFASYSTNVTVFDFNGGYRPASNYSGNGWVLPFTMLPYAAAPAGDSTPYHTASALVSGTDTFTAAPGTSYNYFGLYWGSIDDYNSIKFYNNGSEVASFTGSQIVADLAALGNQASPASNRFVNFRFYDLTFDKVDFTTNGYAFESDNHTFANVPEPGTYAVLAAGILGLAFLRRRRTLAQAAI